MMTVSRVPATTCINISREAMWLYRVQGEGQACSAASYPQWNASASEQR
jgi:hypothetical protein